MAKKSTVTTATTDQFIYEQITPAAPATLPTGVKVAIGFSIAGGSLVLAWCLYKGIKYIITNKNGQQQIQPAPANMNMAGIPQINLTSPSPETAAIINMIQQMQQTQQQQAEQQQNTVSLIQQMLQQQAQQTGVAPAASSEINVLEKQIELQQAQLAQMVSVMNEMTQAIRNHNTDDYNNLLAQLNQERQQREYAESLANHLGGQVAAQQQQMMQQPPYYDPSIVERQQREYAEQQAAPFYNNQVVRPDGSPVVSM